MARPRPSAEFTVQAALSVQTSNWIVFSDITGEEKRSAGLLGERSNERRCGYQAPPVLYATALLLDSTTKGKVIISSCQQFAEVVSAVSLTSRDCSTSRSQQIVKPSH
jgi:hypothetical protein